MKLISCITINGKDYACYFTDDPTQYSDEHDFQLLTHETTLDKTNLYHELIVASQKNDNVLFDWYPIKSLKRLVLTQKLFYYCTQIVEYYDIFPVSESNTRPGNTDKPEQQETEKQVRANHFLYKRFSSHLILSPWDYLKSVITVKPFLERNEIENEFRKRQLCFNIYRNDEKRPKDCYQLLPIDETTQQFLDNQVNLTLERDLNVGTGLLLGGLFLIGFLCTFLIRALIPVAAASKISPDEEQQNSTVGLSYSDETDFLTKKPIP